MNCGLHILVKNVMLAYQTDFVSPFLKATLLPSVFFPSNLGAKVV